MTTKTLKEQHDSDRARPVVDVVGLSEVLIGEGPVVRSSSIGTDEIPSGAIALRSPAPIRRWLADIVPPTAGIAPEDVTGSIRAAWRAE